MGYKLKPGQEEFTIVDGPVAGMNFKKGVEYPKAPEGYENRFVETQDLASLQESSAPAVKPVVSPLTRTVKFSRLKGEENTTDADKDNKELE